MTTPTPHEIRQVAVLDLTGASSGEMLTGVTRISNVATILAHESVIPRLSSIPMDNVATIVPIPEGSRVRLLSGQVVLSGDALSNPDGDPNEVLVTAGQLVLTSRVKHVGFKQLVTAGQVLAPKGSEAALGAALARMAGQVQFYPLADGGEVRVLIGASRVTAAELANPTGQPSDTLLSVGQLVILGLPEQLGFHNIVGVGQVLAPAGSEVALAGRITSLGGSLVTYTAPPRMFDGKDTFYGAFFELLDEPITLVLDGKFTFDDDVSPEVVKQKVAAIVLDGKIIAPRRLVPLLQVLAIARDGKITATDARDD